MSCVYLSSSHKFVVQRGGQGVTFVCVVNTDTPLQVALDFFKAVRKRAEYVLKFLQMEQQTPKQLRQQQEEAQQQQQPPAPKAGAVHRQYMQSLQKNLQLTLWKAASGGSGGGLSLIHI